MTTLVEKILRLDDRLAAEHVPHAFGGALALAYYTEDPRGTDDIDLNVFVEVERAGVVFASLPTEVTWKQSHVDAVRRHGQVRVFWDRTPLDLFFENHPFHAGTARRAQSADLAGHAIPVLDAVDLAVFKAMFDRTRDWADIEAMLEADALDTAAVLGHLTEMLGHDDPITQRFARLAQAGSAPYESYSRSSASRDVASVRRTGTVPRPRVPTRSTEPASIARGDVLRQEPEVRTHVVDGPVGRSGEPVGRGQVGPSSLRLVVVEMPRQLRSAVHRVGEACGHTLRRSREMWPRSYSKKPLAASKK